MRNNPLKKLNDGDYSKTYKDLERFCKENTDLILFGEFGNASCPSISDLDVFICIADDNYHKAHKLIIDFIDADELRCYLFFHDPLIIPESFLKNIQYFHTCYNLHFTYNRNNIHVNTPSGNQLNLLNSIWTTFLIGIGPSILADSKLDLRTKLLVLKNICQSIDNTNMNSDALKLSEEVRNKAINGKLSIIELDNVFEKMLKQLYNCFNHIDNFGESLIYKKKKIKVNSNKVFIKSDRNDFLIKKDNKIEIYLNNELFDLMIQLHYKKSNELTLKNYIEKAIIINAESKKLNMNFPFISPFGLQFYRSDFKYLVKKIINSL